MRIEIGNALRFENLLKEAIHARRQEQHARAAQILEEARLILCPSIRAIRPEDDTARSEHDRQAWRLARGA